MSTTRAGRANTDKLVDDLVDKAEMGFDVDEMLRRRGGRPTSKRASTQESSKPEPDSNRDPYPGKAAEDVPLVTPSHVAWNSVLVVVR